MEYHKISKENVFLKTAMWEVYKKRCVYCGRALLPKHAEIDHILPVSLEKVENSNDEDLQEYIRELTDEKFVLNSIENYMLCCSNCNKRKNNFPFSASNMRYFHELAFRHAEKIWKNYEKNLQIIVEDKAIISQSINIEPKEYNEEELFVECKTVNSGFKIAFCYGLGEVRVDAFLPIRYDDILCCIVYFKSLYQKDIDITFDGDDIVNVLFDGCESRKNPYKRRWCKNMLSLSGEEFYQIDLPNIRVKASAEMIEQFALIMDELFNEYILQQENIKYILGATNFPEFKEEKGSYKILSLRMNVFNMLSLFIQNHSYDDENKPYNIFQICWGGDKVALRRNVNSREDAEVYAYLKFKSKDESYVDVIWQPGLYGIGSESEKMKYFGDSKKWTVQYVHDWLLDELFEVIFNEMNKEKASFFQFIFGRKQNLKYTVSDAVQYGWIKSYSKEGLDA